MRKRSNIQTVDFSLTSDDINDDKRQEFIQFLLTNNIKFETYDDEYFDDLEVEVDFEVVPASKGVRGDHGEPMEPDFEAYIQDLEVYVAIKKDRVDITDYIDNIEKIQREIFEY